MDDEQLHELKRSFYLLAYMDNIKVTSSNEEHLKLAYEKSFGIFNSYDFDLQKFLFQLWSTLRCYRWGSGEDFFADF